VRPAVRILAAELQPDIAHAPIVLAQQQVPGHFLAGVAVGLDARRFELGVEKKGQRQREYFGFARAVVAAQ